MQITTKSGRAIELPSDDEELEIISHAIEDGTLHSDDELSAFKPVTQFSELNKVIKKAGRPKANITKIPVSIRLSADVLDYFKASGKGWQTRVDSILKDYVDSHRSHPM